MFAALMAVGLVWALAWYAWFRDQPFEDRRLSPRELAFILEHRQPPAPGTAKLSLAAMLGSASMWLAMVQYFASNFTFFFMLSWLFPHVRETYHLDPVTAGWYSASTFVAGALGNVASGCLVDLIYRAGRWRLSRQLPAMAGFALAAAGVLLGGQMDSAGAAVFWLSVAVFGADMTLAPSWAFATDLGRQHAGAVSGTMNMAGNLGSFVTTLAFPYLLDWTGSHVAFFYVAAALNALAIGLWALVRPERPLGS
jgi:ACS family glucarate transporter-like MFS transporter